MGRLLKKLKLLPLTVWLCLALLLVGGLGVAAVVGVSKANRADSSSQTSEEVELTFDPEGPYGLLIPRRDGNALNLNLKRTSSYERISYELVYNSEGIDRGVSGDVDTSQKKGELDLEILFGSCSKNVCKYDKEVENGTLKLRIKKGNKIYIMNTQWRLQKPDLALGVLASGDGHFTYRTAAKQADLEFVGFSIINDLSGVPKLPPKTKVFGKAYALNIPLAKNLPAGQVAIELADNPPPQAQIARFEESENSWKMLETKIEGSKLEAFAPGPGIFAVLVP